MPKSVSSGWGAGGALIGSGSLDKDCADVVSSFPGLPEAGTSGERGGEPSVTTAWERGRHLHLQRCQQSAGFERARLRVPVPKLGRHLSRNNPLLTLPASQVHYSPGARS